MGDDETRASSNISGGGDQDMQTNQMILAHALPSLSAASSSSQLPSSVQSSSTARALAVACALLAAVSAVAAGAVTLSASREGLPLGLLTAFVVAPAVFLALVFGVFGAAWLSPTVLAAVVRVLAVEVIRLSRLLASDEELKDDDFDAEDEAGDRDQGDVEGKALRLGRAWAEGRPRAHQPRSQSHGGSHPRRDRERRRRVVVEWEAGQMFLEIRRPVASEWLVALVNRYMHGPIPMKVETCRAKSVRVCLSPTQLLRLGSFQSRVEGLTAFGRRTHEDEWDEKFYYEKAIRFRRWAADYVQALIEGTYGRKMKSWGGIVDSLINNLTFDITDLHLRVDDRWEGHSFGLMVDRCQCSPGVKETESMGATPHEFVVNGVLFYVDAHNEVSRSPECPAVLVERGTFRVEFPDIFRTLILNREIMPGGRGKRLRVRGEFSEVIVNVQANQMRTYLFSLLGTFCPYKYSAWKATIREQAAKDCIPVVPSQRESYLQTFGTLREERNLTSSKRKERMAKLAELERCMSYRDILLLRKEARGWRLEDMGEEPPAVDPPLDPDFMRGLSSDDPQYEELARYSARIQSLQLSAWEKSTYLREIMVETVVIHRLEARLSMKADPSRDGPENRAFRTPLQAVARGSKLGGRFRMFLSRTKASKRLHSRGANGVDGEPALPWLMAAGYIQHPVVLDEATAARLGYGSTSIVNPTKVNAAAHSETRFGDGRSASVADARNQGSAGEGAMGDDTIPEAGGTFKMWSDYRMAIEGHAQYVQAGTLLPPIMDIVWTVVDSFRRRWAAGGQYPERKLAHVRLAEEGGASLGPRRGTGDGGTQPGGASRGLGGSAVEVVNEGHPVSDANDAAGSDKTTWSRVRWDRTLQSLSLLGYKPPSEAAADEARDEQGETLGSEHRDEDDEEEDSDLVARERTSRSDSTQPHGFKQVLSRLDGLDSGALVEEALEDLHDQERRLTLPSSGSAENPAARRERRSRGGSGNSDLEKETDNVSDVATALEMVPPPDPRSLSSSIRGPVRDEIPVSAVAEGEGDVADPAIIASQDVAAAAEAAASQQPIAEKFMLPGWHYLYLSGRAISIDFRWKNVDLLLMQDPTVRQGRDSGKNVLALRSSGTLSTQSTRPGESVDLEIVDASLLPCFYVVSREDEPRARARWWRRAHGDPDDVVLWPDERVYTWPQRESRFANAPGARPSRRLADVLGGGERAEAAAGRTWLGQGLTIADSRPLLEPFNVKLKYGTVVAKTAQEGHGTGVTASDARTIGAQRGGGQGEDYQSDDEDGKDGEDGTGMNRGRKGEDGEMVAGVFRVAISELQLLVAQAKLKRPATVEVEVEGQTRSFPADAVMSTSEGDSVELEFVCRCNLHRGQERQQASAAVNATKSDPDDVRIGPKLTRGKAIVGVTEGDEREEGEEDDVDPAPEAAATVRLRGEGGTVLGEAWADLPGAPEGWARYPLYSPGTDAASDETPATTGSVSNGTITRIASDIDDVVSIPAPPGTLRRRWGWGVANLGGTVSVAAMVRNRPWFRARLPRDVAGELKLRLTWIPSGLAVTIHRWRQVRSRRGNNEDARAACDPSVQEDSVESKSGVQRRLIVVHAEPGGGSADVHPIMVEEKGRMRKEVVANRSEKGGEVGDGDADISTGRTGLSPRSVAGDGAHSIPDGDEDQSDKLFFSLDPACLLNEVDTESIVRGGNDVIVSTGGGARLVLSTDEGEFDGSANAFVSTEAKGNEESTSNALRAEVLLIPGAKPARRWISLTSASGTRVEEVDISLGWAVAPPYPPSPGSAKGAGGEDLRPEVPPSMSQDEEDTSRVALAGGQTSTVPNAAESASAAATGAGVSMGGGVSAGNSAKGGPFDGVRSGDVEAKEADTDEEEGEAYPEPAQVVQRFFTMRVSDLVLRVSDLDVAVLATMAKGIMRVFKPPKSKEERELELEAVQQRLLEEANSKRKAAIQQLEAAFQHSPRNRGSLSAASDGGGDSASRTSKGTDGKELLDVQDVVELLRDFLRGKALTESEINREVEEFMLVVLAVADAAKHWTVVKGRSRSESPVGRRSSRGGSASTNPARSRAGGVRGREHARVGRKRESGRRRWLPRLRADLWSDKEKHLAAHAVEEGFICPQCRKKLSSPAALMAHFHGYHGGSGSRETLRGYGSDGGLDADSAGDTEVSSDEGAGGDERRMVRARSCWRGGSISLDHFILALQSFMEEQPHEGDIMARCEEFASDDIKRVILGGYATLQHRLAATSPVESMRDFWHIMKTEVGVTRRSGGGQQVRVVQTRMVRALKNYAIARLAWSHLVVPALWRVPRCSLIKASSGRVYLPMPTPVREGQPYCVDKPAMVITHLPLEFSGARDMAEGSAAEPGSGASAMLSGIMTHSKDRGLSGVPAFLTFTLDRPAVVYVCYDQRLKRLPVWLRYFDRTGWIVGTTEGLFGVWRKRYAKGQVRLGCNEGWRKGCANYFLLFGADYPIHQGATGSEDRAAANPSSPPLSGSLPPHPSPPVGLLPDGDVGDTDFASPRWVLRPQMVAGGKGSLAQAVRALVDERRKSRAMARSQLLPGGESRVQLNAAAATAADLGLELAPVLFHYTAEFSLGKVSLRIVDPAAVATTLHVKAEVRLSHADGSLDLRHLHPGDWLGRPDSLMLHASVGGCGTYHNPLVNEREHCIEPWSGAVECRSDRGKPTTQIRMEMPEHLVLNVSSALVENIKTIATLVARNWSGRYTAPSKRRFHGAGAGGSLVVHNSLGVSVVIQGQRDEFSSDGRWFDRSDSMGSVVENDGIGPTLHDISLPTTLPAGQAVACGLPAANASSSGIPDVELVVYVPGYQTISSVKVGSRGSRAYPLVEKGHGVAPAATSDNTAWSGGKGTAGPRSSYGRRGLALVVDVREETTPTGATGDSSASMVVGGLVMELRTNVCLQNASASDVEVDIGVATAAAATSSEATLGMISGRIREGWMHGGGSVRVVRVSPGARLALPVSALSSWQLRIVGDATDTRYRPLRLSPALLDQAVPNALRLTGNMERNSLCLKVAKGGITAVVASAQGDSNGFGSAGSSPRSRKSYRGSPVQRPPSPETDDSTASTAGTSRSTKISPPPSPSSRAPRSTAADWVLTVQPSYLISNALPCALELELLQPVGTNDAGPPRVNEGQRSRGLDSYDRMDSSKAEERDIWNDSNSDTSSATSSTTTATTSTRHPGRKMSSGNKGAVRNPALDLFFLPSSVGREDSERFARKGGMSSENPLGVRGGDRSSAGRGDPHLLWLDAQREPDSTGGFESAWKGVIGSGQEAKVGRVDTTRPFYVRVRLPDPGGGTSHCPPPPCCHWSDLLMITVYEHARRTSFNSRQPEDVTWVSAARENWGRSAGASQSSNSGNMREQHEGTTSRQRCPELKVARSWGRSSARRLTFYAPYWIVNKTGLALNYRAKFPQKTFKILSDSPDRTRVNMVEGRNDVADGGSSAFDSDTRGLMKGGNADGSMREPQGGKRTPISSAEEAARVQDATYISDEENLAFFGGRSVPVMVGCPAQTLEVMPYALAGWSENAGLCVCDLQVDSDSASLYHCSADPRPGSRLYTDCAVHAVRFPADIEEAAARPRSAVQILSPWREPPAPEREAFITFWVNRDTHVHVCMDSRTPPSKLPSWLEYAGFRKKPGAVITTSESGLVLQVYRRFFRARTLVRLGGSDNGRDLATALTDFSGASVTPDGPAPKGMLANYTVILTTLPERPPEPSPSPLGLREMWSNASDDNPLVESGAASTATVSYSAANFGEADVRDVVVDRDVGESIMCRRRYRILPDFVPGDRPYVDRDYTIPFLPEKLQGLRLTCVQTAQGDKRAGGSRFWRFSLMQDSVVLVIFDARATSVPHWLASSGFTLWEGVEIAGAEYRIPYVYKVYRKRCSTGLVWLGGNGAKGCKGAKRGYFVLIHVAEHPVVASLSLPASCIPQQPSGERGTGGMRNNSFSSRPRGSSAVSDSLGYDSEAGTATVADDEESLASTPFTPREQLGLSRASGSRSFHSLDGMTRSEVGEHRVNEGRPRSMSTTMETPTKATTPGLERDSGGRTRAWTGGDEDLLRATGSPSNVEGRHVGRFKTRSRRVDSRVNDEAPEGLQRISAVWDREKDGPLLQIPVSFDRVGRTWSRTFNVEAANTAGPLETSGATLGVSVSALTGQFHRTRVVTLYPRFIVRNFLGIPLEVMPTVMSPKATAVSRLSQCLPRSLASKATQEPPSGYRRSHGSQTQESRGGRGKHSTPSPELNMFAESTRHLVQTVPTSAAVAVYGFNPADQLVKELCAAERSAGCAPVEHRDGSSGLGVGGEPDDHHHCILLRAAAPTSNGDASLGEFWTDGDDHLSPEIIAAEESSRRGGVGGGFGTALANGLSRPVLADDMGETHLWVVDSRGRRHLAAAFVSLQRATVFITLSPSTQFPPFRVENRSSTDTLAYRQEDADRTMGWHILPPLTWHTFVWQEPHKPRAIEVAFAGSLTPSASSARHREVYSLDKVGEREPLEEEAGITRSVWRFVDTGTHAKTLASEVRVEGRTRVLSFGDVRLSESQAHGAYADNVVRLKQLYTQLDGGIHFSGLSLNVVVSSSEGPTEVMSTHVDSLTVVKRSGGNRVELQIFHVQVWARLLLDGAELSRDATQGFGVDDMRRRTRMPVVLQPFNSGFNSHLRGITGGEGEGRGGDACAGGAGSAAPVPFLSVLYEREVATLSMPHLKSLEIELQEMRVHIDLEFVLYLLGLAGAVLPELTSEEVLARMCRKTAKRAVRHTVPTPAKRDLSMIYLEGFRHSPIVVRLELFVGQGALSPDAAALEDPEKTTGGLTIMGAGFLSVLSVVGSSIAHVNPTFFFDEMVVAHYCGGLRGLITLVLTAITSQAVAQGYKVVGSMELLGDPLSLMNKVGESVVQFLHKTRAEMTGSADTMGAGATVLMKGLVGGTFGSAAKITGSLEGMIRGLSGTAILEENEFFENGGEDEGGGEVRDLEHGVKQGGKVFYESMKAGISGLMDHPMEGAKEEGFAGFIAGMAKGIVGAVAAPVAGALGAVARVTEGVDASTRLSDEKSMGRRRAARTLVAFSLSPPPQSRALALLTPTDLLKHIPRGFAALWTGYTGASRAPSGVPMVRSMSTPPAGEGCEGVIRDEDSVLMQGKEKG